MATRDRIDIDVRDVTTTEEGRMEIEASALGWEPGVFHPVVHIEGHPYEKIAELRDAPARGGDLLYVLYRNALTRRTLLVVND